MTVKLRYKEPDGDRSRLLAVAVKDGTQTDSPDVRFAAAVAAFAEFIQLIESARTLAEGETSRVGG